MHYFTKIVLTFIGGSALLVSKPTQTVANPPLAVFYTLQGNIEKSYNTLVEEKLKTIDFSVTDPHKRVNDQYKVKYGSTVLDVLSFMPVVNNKVMLPLLNIEPRIAGFGPFNMLIHKRLDENVTHVGHLTPETMLDILGIENQEVREKFSAPFEKLDTLIAKELGGTQSFLPYVKLPQNRMIHFEYAFETPEDMDDFIDEFQNKFELAFIDQGYLIAGYHNFMESTDDAEEILSNYDAFWTYSLCHLKFSYNMFDTQNAHPEAGLFAPCTMYMYIKKGSNKIVVGMLKLKNWVQTLGIEETKRLDLVKKLDTQIPQIMTAFGMQQTNPTEVQPTQKLAQKSSTATKQSTQQQIQPHVSKANSTILATTTPKSKQKNVQRIKLASGTIEIHIPTVPKAIQLSETPVVNADRSIKFSKRVPPNYTPHRFENQKREKSHTHTNIGKVNKNRVSAHLRGEFMDVKSVEAKLKAGGFQVIASVPLNKKSTLTSIVFTNQTLQELGNKKGRGFIASLRVLVDSETQMISITNPLYFSKGFLQEEFDNSKAHTILAQLIHQFPTLKNSEDSVKFQLLPNYQFMNGMPKYHQMITVASGEDLLSKIENNTKIVFTQKLANGSTLIGVDLQKRTKKFTKRIGTNNAAMLPYPVLIEDNKALILDPKYYIAIMYPKLTMSEFMTIATIPAAIVKDCERVLQ